jgi:hypothetical protein
LGLGKGRAGLCAGTCLSEMPPSSGSSQQLLIASKSLAEVRQHQFLMFSRLAELDVIIETCPVSNLRSGAVPEAEHHLIHRFLQSDIP